MENVSETSYAAVPKLGPKSEICNTTNWLDLGMA